MATTTVRRQGTAAGWIVAGAVVALAVAVVMYVWRGWYYGGSDFQVYHQGALAVLHGRSPYDFGLPHGLMFIYPPFAAIVFTPLGLLADRAAFTVWTLISALALEVTVWLVLSRIGPADRRRRAMFTVLATVAALPLYPVLSELALGQVNILLMLLVLVDLLVLPRRWRGIGIGLAAGVKLTPLIFVPYLLFTRRFREAAVAVATFAVTIGLGFAIMPAAAARYWSGLFLDVNRMLPPGSASYNDAFSAALGRLFGNTAQPGVLWTVIGVLAGLAALVLAIVISRRDDLLGIVTCAAAGLLISPVAWPAHWVWLVPVLLLWVRRAVRERSGAHAAGIVLVWLALALDLGWSLLSLLGDPVPTGLAGELLADLPVLLGVAFLVSLAVTPRRPAEAVG
jgi:alpha-1,2-mannosyltransferase